MCYVGKGVRGGNGKRIAQLIAAGFWIACACAGPAGATVGDANCDGELDGRDLNAVIAALYNGSSCVDADVNGDRTLSVADLTAYVQVSNPPLPTPTATETGTDTVTPTITETPIFFY